MNEQVKLTNTQQKKVDIILGLLANCMGKYKDDYEIREKDINYLENTPLIYLYAVLVYKKHETSVFGDRVHVFITKRGKVTYYDHKDDKIKTWTGSNIWTLICANN